MRINKNIRGKSAINRHVVLVKQVVRTRNGLAGNIRIPVTVKKQGRKFVRDIDADWIVLVRTDGLEFPTSEIVEICPYEELPLPTDKLFAFHSPVELFNSGQLDSLGIFLTEKDNGFYSESKIIIKNGVFKGSSGGLYVSHNGKAVAMHTETCNDLSTTGIVVAKNSDVSLDNLTSVSDTHDSMTEGILLCKYPDILRYA